MYYLSEVILSAFIHFHNGSQERVTNIMFKKYEARHKRGYAGYKCGQTFAC